MTEEEIETATVAHGVWLYDGQVAMPVRIIGLPFDYWFALGKADDLLERGETPRTPGPDGLLYYIWFAQFVGSVFNTVEDAKKAAQACVKGQIRWC